MGDWNPKANELFVQAAELGSVELRNAFLAEHCGQDAELRRQVESLLAASERAGDFLQQPVALAQQPLEATAAYGLVREGPGTMIGPYKLLQQIGEGGFGVVFMAEQERPVRRMVALKIIKPGMDTAQVIARFESERQALAIMDHPHIAKVLDAGATDSGRPYFVMELVRGVPITEFCDKNRLSAAERLKLFSDVCHAIQHAHHKGIIHRDIKPSNVLVTLNDTVPVVKVIDFGVAKATVQKLTERTMFTAYGQMIGTPAYMSPEQAEMSGLDIDTRSDIYSLGVLLYELLTGTTPLEMKRLREAGYAEIQRLIREEEAQRPSTRLSSLGESATILAGNRGTDVKHLARLLRGDLDWIVMKALEKDRNRRYASPGNFAEDIHRYLRNDTIVARPPSNTYRLKKFVRRNRGALLAASVLVLALLGFVTTVIAVQVRANRALEAKNAELAAEQAKVVAKNQELAAEQAKVLHKNQELAAEQAKVVAKNQELAAEQAKVLAREHQAIEAVKKFRDAVAHEPELKNSPALEDLRKRLLKEPLAFFRDLRTQLEADNEPSPESLRRLAEATHEFGFLAEEIGDRLDALTAYRESLEIYRKLDAQYPADRQAEADSGKTRFRGGVAIARMRLGNMLSEIGKTTESEAEYRDALRLLEELARDVPTFRPLMVETRGHLGQLLVATGRLAEAEVEYREAMALLKEMADQGHFDLKSSASLHHQLGNLLQTMGRSEDADVEYRQGILIYQQLMEDHPERVDIRVALARLQHDFGHLLYFGARLAEAEVEYRKALAQQLKLVASYPTSTSIRKSLAITHRNLGILLRDTDRPAEALAEISQAQALYQRLVDENPTFPQFHDGLADSHLILGTMLDRIGKREEALAQLRKAVMILQKLVEDHPTVLEHQSVLAASHYHLARLLILNGRHAEAEVDCRRAVALYRKLVDDSPSVAISRPYLAASHNCLGVLLLRTARPKEAVAEFRRSFELDPTHMALTNLATAERQAAVQDQLPAFLAGDLQPTTTPERLALAQLCATKGLYRASTEWYTQAFAADAEIASEHRYEAACSASKAAAGRGEDSAHLDATQRAQLRKQAIAWLHQALAEHAQKLDNGQAADRANVRESLNYWQHDILLADLRDLSALESMPEAERADCQALWTQVAELLAKASSPSSEDQP